MARFGIPCPKFIKLKKHVLVMEFIGRDRVPAPTLRDVKFSAADAELCYEQCVTVCRGVCKRTCILFQSHVERTFLLFGQLKCPH